MNKKSFPQRFNPKGRSNSNTFKHNRTWSSLPRKDNSSNIPEKSKSLLTEFDPTKRDCLSWIKAKPSIILMFQQHKCWDIVNYEDHGTELEDGTFEFEEEELGDQPDQEVYVKEMLDIAQRAKTQSFERRRRDNSRAYRNCGPDRVSARDDELAKIKTDEEVFSEEEHLRRSQYCRDYQTLIYRPWIEKRKEFQNARSGAIKVFKELLSENVILPGKAEIENNQFRTAWYNIDTHWGDLYGSEKVEARIQRELAIFTYNGYDMIEKHIQKLEDLVKQSPHDYDDRWMKNSLVNSIKFSNSAPKFSNFLNWVNTIDGITYSSLKKKLVDLVVDDIESERRTKQLTNAKLNYRANNTEHRKFNKPNFSHSKTKAMNADLKRKHSDVSDSGKPQCETCGKHRC
jgi:hypothetical protein